MKRGYVVLWAFIVIAALSAAITSIEFTVDERPQNPEMHAWFAVSMIAMAIGLFVEARRDLYSVCVFGIVATLVTAMITGSVAFFGYQPHPIAATVSVVSGLTFIACAAWIARNQLAREAVPNILRDRFAGTKIFESDGVHLVVTQTQTAVKGGEIFEVQLFAQNCWDHERTLVFELAAEPRIALNRAGLVFPKQSKLVLPPLAVAALTIPIAAEPKANGTHSLIAAATTHGTGGTRIRKWRGSAMSRPISPWVTGLGLLGGMLIAGGGLKLRVHVQRTDALPAQPREPTPEILWSPTDSA